MIDNHIRSGPGSKSELRCVRSDQMRESVPVPASELVTDSESEGALIMTYYYFKSFDQCLNKIEGAELVQGSRNVSYVWS